VVTVAEAEANILDNRAAAAALYQVHDILLRIICVLVNLGSGGDGGRSHGYGLESSGRFAIGPGPTADGGVGGC